MAETSRKKEDQFKSEISRLDHEAAKANQSRSWKIHVPYGRHQEVRRVLLENGFPIDYDSNGDGSGVYTVPERARQKLVREGIGFRIVGWADS